MELLDTSFIVINLRRQVVLQASEPLYLILDDQWRVRRQHKLDIAAQCARLVEHVQIPQREGQVHLLVLGGLVGPALGALGDLRGLAGCLLARSHDLYAARTNLTLNIELD